MDNKRQQSSTLIQNLLNNVDIVSVIKNYINLDKKGQNFWGLCPFHGDRSPSLSVNSSKKVFKCFSCGESGNAITFVQKFKKVNFFQAIKEIVELTDYKTDLLDKFINTKINSNETKMIDMNQQACFIYHRTLLKPENSGKLNYLLSRNLTKELIQQYQIGYAPNENNKKYLFSILTNENDIMGSDRDASLVWSPIQLVNNGLANLNDDNQYSDFFWNRIIIPIYDEYSNIVGFSGRTLNQDEKIKYLNTKTTEIFKKENILFNFNNFDKSDYKEIFVVEGYMDVFALRRIKIDNVVASMGTSFTSNQINLIKKYQNIKSVVICFDNDEAGLNATIELAEKLYKSNLKVFVVAPYDKSIKDIDELLKLKGEQQTIKALNNQISFIEYLCYKTFENKNLSKKDVILETQKILNIMVDWAYDELCLEVDLKCLSKYNSISVDSLKQYIEKYQRNKQDSSFNNNKFNKNSSFPPNFDYYVPKMASNSKSLNTILKEENNYELKEKDLFKIICINSLVAELYLEHIYHPYFQKNQTIKYTFTKLVYFIKILVDNSIKISIETLLELIKLKKDEFNDSLQDLTNFLNDTSTYFQKFPINEYDSSLQGISLLIDLLLEIQKHIEAQIIMENKPNNKEEYHTVNLKYSKKIKDLINIKNGLVKNKF